MNIIDFVNFSCHTLPLQDTGIETNNKLTYCYQNVKF